MSCQCISTVDELKFHYCTTSSASDPGQSCILILRLLYSKIEEN
jgi:hypothetical protein